MAVQSTDLIIVERAGVQYSAPVSALPKTVGYVTGEGGAVAQATSRTTGVTLNKASGAITLFSTTAAASQLVTFTVTNSTIALTDTINVSVRTATGIYIVTVTKVVAGSFNVTIFTPVAVTVAEAPVINFAVVKGVAA